MVAIKRGSAFDPEFLQEFEDGLFFDGPRARRKIINFTVLLLLATVIATYGVILNSDATVIGAMIVAPLMTPIMATTAALVLADSGRAARAGLTVILGVAAVILFAALLTWFIPGAIIGFSTNDQILSRTSPGLDALLVALASGAAGAFCLSRREISNSLPGVAIAISLVPPLCVVGMSFIKGEWADAGGAFLLFMTNCLAILLAGGIVFWVMGLHRSVDAQDHARVRRGGFALVVVGILLVTVPLTVTAWNVLESSISQATADQSVESWLGTSTWSVAKINVSDPHVNVVITGYGSYPPVVGLAKRLSDQFGHPMSVVLRTVQEGFSQYPPSTTPGASSP